MWLEKSPLRSETQYLSYFYFWYLCAFVYLPESRIKTSSIIEILWAWRSSCEAFRYPVRSLWKASQLNLMILPLEFIQWMIAYGCPLNENKAGWRNNMLNKADLPYMENEMVALSWTNISLFVRERFIIVRIDKCFTQPQKKANLLQAQYEKKDTEDKEIYALMIFGQ